MIVIKEVVTKERCDSCPARATFRITLETGKLYFCTHHFNEHKDALNKL